MAEAVRDLSVVLDGSRRLAILHPPDQCRIEEAEAQEDHQLHPAD